MNTFVAPILVTLVFFSLIAASYWEWRRTNEWRAAWMASNGQGWWVGGEFPNLVVSADGVELRFLYEPGGKSGRWVQEYRLLRVVSFEVRRTELIFSSSFETTAPEPVHQLIRLAWATGLEFETKGAHLFARAAHLCGPEQARRRMRQFLEVAQALPAAPARAELAP